MFVLTTISDVIQIAPTDFEPRKKSIHAIEDNIHQKYANKVLQQVGLCICFWDLLKASEGLISQGDGMANVNAVFRLVVFRPFKGEILQGTITEANIEGIRVSVDMFDDIWIPGPRLMQLSHWSDKDQTWIWDYEGQLFYYEIGEQVRLRVEQEVWHDKTPGKEGENGEAPVEMMVPYSIIGSMADSCLGCLLWWEGEEVEGEVNGMEIDQVDTTAGAEDVVDDANAET